MSLAVTITACRRPAHTLRCIRAVRRAGYLNLILVSIDNVGPESDAVWEAIKGEDGVKVQTNQPALGLWRVQNNHWAALDMAFETLGVEAVVALEDDAIVSPDAFELVQWFLENGRQHLFLNLANNTPNEGGNPNDIWESCHLNSPWAWCLTRDAWHKIRPRWNFRRQPPYGWDWSLHQFMAEAKLLSLVPALPRARNIGAVGSSTGGDNWYKEHLQGAEYSDGTHGSDYRLRTITLPLQELNWWEPWMRPGGVPFGGVDFTRTAKPFAPLISICHTTARPEGWQTAWGRWQAVRSMPGSDYEYLLSMDRRQAAYLPRLPHQLHRSLIHDGPESNNHAYNDAALKSCGKLIILAADDIFAPEQWDAKLLNVIAHSGYKLEDDFVVWVSTVALGGKQGNDPNLIMLPILSRARMLKYGYAIWPEYPTVYADNDFTAMALRDNCIVDARNELLFEHRHFTHPRGLPKDAVYERQNLKSNYIAGEKIFLRRQSMGFPALNGQPARFVERNDFAEQLARKFAALGEMTGYTAAEIVRQTEDPQRFRKALAQAFEEIGAAALDGPTAAGVVRHVAKI